jgi:3-methyladenine DNA glycosylase/8-oxoguanine DNA glycosylase
MGLGDETFERMVRSILDSQIKVGRTDKQKKDYIKKLKDGHRDKLDLIDKILKDYEK